MPGVPLPTWLSKPAATDAQQREPALPAVSYGFDELYRSGSPVVSQPGKPIPGLHGLPLANTRLERRPRVLQVRTATYDDQILIRIASNEISAWRLAAWCLRLCAGGGCGDTGAAGATVAAAGNI